MRTPFTGVGTALVTPFTTSGALDEPAVRRPCLCRTPGKYVPARSKSPDKDKHTGSDHPAAAPARLLRCERHRRRCLMPRLEKLLRHFGITKLFSVKIHHRYMRTVFHFRLSQIVQMLFPVAELFQVFGDVFRKQDVLGIA